VFAASVDLAAAALAFATLVGAAVPLAIGRRRLHRLLVPGDGPRFEVGSALRFAAPASLIAGADQLLVNGAPVLVMLEGGADAARAAGVVFAATMLVRVPVYMFQGLAASLLPNITHMQAADQVAEIRRGVTRTSAVLLGTGLVIVAFTAAVGPESMRLLFGGDFEAGRTALTLLGAGVGFYLAAATITQALLALDCGARAASAWVASALLFVALYLAVPGSELGRVSTAFAIATLVALLTLALTLAGRLARR
jgi:O-antigen/teichoic acid export membrane protein